MRAASLLPLAFTAALVAACGSEMPGSPEREEGARRSPAAPERDLTLQAPAPTVKEVASPVELARPEPPARPARVARPRARPKPASPPPPEPDRQPAAELVAAPALPAASAPVEPPAGPVVAGGGRELAPGKTVTIIPISNEPGIEADEGDAWLPSERARGIGGGGGTCRKPRGGVRRNGITGRIPVGFPAPLLR